MFSYQNTHQFFVSVSWVSTHCALCAPPGSMKLLHQTTNRTWRTAFSLSPPQLWGHLPGSQSHTPSPPPPWSSFSVFWQGWTQTGKPLIPSPLVGRRKVGRPPPRCGWACLEWSSPGLVGWTGGAGGAGKLGSHGRERCLTWDPDADTWRWRYRRLRGMGGGGPSPWRQEHRTAWVPGRGQMHLGQPRQWRQGPSVQERPVELAGRRGCPSWRGGGGPFTSLLTVLRRVRVHTESKEIVEVERKSWATTGHKKKVVSNFRRQTKSNCHILLSSLLNFYNNNI